MRTILFVLVIMLILPGIKAQTPLEKGDIAFIAINSDGSTDDFSFILLKDIESSTQINFTDNGWTALDNFNNTYPESHFTWTANTALTAGEIIRIVTYNGVEQATSSTGTITGDKMTISVAGDQVLAYQGEKSAPYFIAAISFNHNITEVPGDDFDGDSYSNSTTSMPLGLTLGINAVHIHETSLLTESDNTVYNCITTSGTKADLLTAINNVNNWNFNNDTPFDLDPLSCPFDVSAATSINAMLEQSTSIYPNPASSILYISLEFETDAKAQIYNSSGLKFDEFIIPANSHSYNYSVDQLATGIYYLRIDSNKNKIVKKFSVIR